jgi:hypothetical protein
MVMPNTKNQFINAKPLKDFDMILHQGYAPQDSTKPLLGVWSARIQAVHRFWLPA